MCAAGPPRLGVSPQRFIHQHFVLPALASSTASPHAPGPCLGLLVFLVSEKHQHARSLPSREIGSRASEGASAKALRRKAWITCQAALQLVGREGLRSEVGERPSAAPHSSSRARPPARAARRRGEAGGSSAAVSYRDRPVDVSWREHVTSLTSGRPELSMRGRARGCVARSSIVSCIRCGFGQLFQTVR